MERRPSLLPTLGAIALNLALAACQRSESTQSASQTEGADTSGSAASQEAEAPTDSKAAMDAEAKRYYEDLVKRYGQDYEACGPSQRALPKECEAAEDVAGAKPGGHSNVLLMLDASGSMAAGIGGETKMAAAQDALIQFSGKLPASANVALRVYGHTGNNQESGKAESCAGSELLYPFEKLDAARFETAVRSFKPTGWTPIAASLAAAAQDFAKAPAKDGSNVVYVVSDGIETCDADPVEAARKLHASDIDVVVNVIGFAVDAEAAKQLEAVAKAGGGEYLVADTRDDLNRIFNERTSAAINRYNCVTSGQTNAYNETSAAQVNRYNCLSGKATNEYNDVTARATNDYNSLTSRLDSDGNLTPEKRDAAYHRAKANLDYVNALARIKKQSIENPASREHEQVEKDARDTLEASNEAETKEFQERMRRAETERAAGEQP